jgi:ribonucleoside-diphosphate reductase beta chain
MSVFNHTERSSYLKRHAFLDPAGAPAIQRYDDLKYKQFDKLTEQQLGFFWQPSEVDILRDAADFKGLNDHEKHIFTSNLKRQILLDSVQGRAPVEAFASIATIPELEAWIIQWSANETIHSRSYTHIIRNVYADPSKIFDEMLDIAEIIECADDISKNYDDLITMTKWFQLFGEGTHTVTSAVGDTSTTKTISLYELKKALYKAIASVNILEGIRFYVSFACSWAFAEMKKMEGNAKIIKLIARDENLHLAVTQTLMKLLPKDDPDYITIVDECKDEILKMYLDAVEQEKAWADYLFKDGSIIGLNASLLHSYIDWIAHKRMHAVGIECPYKVPQSNPLPWTQKWIAGGDVQMAPQEVEISSYISGGTIRDVDGDTFKGFSL